jgi:hypothetical protein
MPCHHTRILIFHLSPFTPTHQFFFLRQILLFLSEIQLGMCWIFLIVNLQGEKGLWKRLFTRLFSPFFLYSQVPSFIKFWENVLTIKPNIHKKTPKLISKHNYCSSNLLLLTKNITNEQLTSCKSIIRAKDKCELDHQHLTKGFDMLQLHLR